MAKYKVVVLADGTIDVDADPRNTQLLQLEDWNKEAVLVLNNNGFFGKHMTKNAPKLDQSIHLSNVTVAGTQEQKDLLANASTHGAPFHATYADELNLDKFFIMEE